MINDFKVDYDWAECFVEDISHILKANAGDLIEIKKASYEEDTKQATDLVIVLGGGEVAVRLRRPGTTQRDLTLRAYRLNAKTELHKIREGWGRWYFYGWVNEYNKIEDWILVDLDRLRGSGLLDHPHIIFNPDGETGFIAIFYQMLEYRNCLVNYCIGGKHLYSTSD